MFLNNQKHRLAIDFERIKQNTYMPYGVVVIEGAGGTELETFQLLLAHGGK